MNTYSLPKRKPLLLFVDDDRITSGYYRELLEKSYQVIYCDSCDQAENFMAMGLPFAGFIFDMMMPPPSGDSSNSTDDGMLSGVFLSKLAMKNYSTAPVFILSNRPEPDFRDAMKELPKTFYSRKISHPPEKFEDFVKSRIQIESSHVIDRYTPNDNSSTTGDL